MFVICAIAVAQVSADRRHRPPGFRMPEAFIRNSGNARTAPVRRFLLANPDWRTFPTTLCGRSRPRAEEGILGKYDWKPRGFAKAVQAEIRKGPDFAGRLAILSWSCGTWCRNATIADVRTRKTYDTPFVGIVGCEKITGNFDTLQRRADSSLLIARGSLEMSFGQYSDGGPCGTYYFQWRVNRLRLIGCDIPAEDSNHQ